MNKLDEIGKYLVLWRRNWSLIWTAVPRLTVGWAALLVVQGLLPVVTVYLTKLTIDSFVFARSNREDAAALNLTIFYFLMTGASFLLAEVFRYLSDWVRTAQAEYFSDFIKNRIHARSAEVDLEFYESSQYHDLMERARGESQSKPLSILESFGAVVQGLITLVSFGAILLSYGWEVPVLLVVGALPGLYLTLKYNRIYHRWWEQRAAERRRLMYYDAMLSHSDVAAEMRLFDLSAKFRGKYQEVRARLRSEKLAQLKTQFSGKLAGNVLTLGTAAVAIGWIAWRVYNNLATLGDLAVFYQVFSRGQTILSSLFSGVGQLIGNTLYLENLFAFFDMPAKIKAPAAPKPFPRAIRQGIHFKNVTFTYPGETRPVVTDLDLFIPTGRKIAVVGVNGAGKSTLIKLICRFYDPQEGAIEIDGVDIREFDVRELRRNISVLFQFPVQFQDSTVDNIAFGDTEAAADRQRIETAARRAGAHSFIQKLAAGYETLLGKWFVDGSELSGGEWQKIALARAYFRQAQIIVLDEPTSFMDSWGEVDWFDRFKGLSETRTGLIITHRFTIAMRADVIYVVAGGRIVESGSHRDLVARDGLYAESWKAQMSAAGEAEPVAPAVAR